MTQKRAESPRILVNNRVQRVVHSFGLSSYMVWPDKNAEKGKKKIFVEGEV